MTLPAHRQISLLKQAWTIGSSTRPDEARKKTEDPRGQSAPTALVLQERLGGTIQKLTVHFENGPEETHYRNVIDGEIVDPSWAEYENHPVLKDPQISVIETASRSTMLKDETIKEKYNHLKEKTDKIISKQEERIAHGRRTAADMRNFRLDPSH